MHRCEEDMNLLDEWDAVSEVLAHFRELEVIGAAIHINDKIEAITIGELLNKYTAVIHIEKANPEIKELYSVINQHFTEKAFSHVQFINREQDLGQEGLRKAKMSYHPDNMIEKYRITLNKKGT
jgi:hypothetical protein